MPRLRPEPTGSRQASGSCTCMAIELARPLEQLVDLGRQHEAMNERRDRRTTLRSSDDRDHLAVEVPQVVLDTPGAGALVHLLDMQQPRPGSDPGGRHSVVTVHEVLASSPTLVVNFTARTRRCRRSKEPLTHRAQRVLVPLHGTIRMNEYDYWPR